MPTSRTWRLRHLLIMLTALGLLPIALLGAWGINATVKYQKRELERSMLGQSRALASAVDSELETTIGALRTLSYNPALAKGDIATFYAVARQAAAAQRDWALVILTDSSGRVLFNTALPYGSPPMPMVQPESLGRVLSTREPVVGHIARGRGKRLLIPVRVPVFTHGQLNYVLSVAIHPASIRSILQRQQVPGSWVISVQDGSNLRVARSKDHDKTVATGISPTLASLMHGAQLEGSGVSRTLEGDEAITSFARAPRHGWSVVIGAPTARFSDALRHGFALYAAVIAASLALCIALAVLIARRLTEAIGRLQQQALRLGRGQPVQVVDSAVYEVNQMGRAIQAAAAEHAASERQRAELMASLNDALASLREALARAEEAGMAKDNFLAVLGHELRNPLAPIVTALDLMDMKGDQAHLRERQIMRRQVEHMKRLVDDLLDVSRITQGKLAMREAPVNLRNVAQQAIEAVHPAVVAGERKIVTLLPQDVWVSGDESRLVQVVTNLLANALRYGRQGQVVLSLSGTAREARIAVRDEGAGMTGDTAAHVFEPFYQAPQSLARSSGGLGLGLTIVRSIVELHGGRVSAASAGLEQGSTFEVLLPAIAAPRQPEPVGGRAEPTRAARLVVVDDNVDAAATTAELLGIAGHRVDIAHDGKSALALIARTNPELAILDIGLPDMDGFALARAIRASGWRGKLIALTGYGQDADKSKSAGAGFDLHLTKPVDIDQLLGAIGLAEAR